MSPMFQSLPYPGRNGCLQVLQFWYVYFHSGHESHLTIRIDASLLSTLFYPFLKKRLVPVNHKFLILSKERFWTYYPALDEMVKNFIYVFALRTRIGQMVPVGMIDDPSRLGAYYYIINVYERRSTRTPNATLDRQPKAVPKSAFTLRNQKKVDFTKKKITLSPVGNGICEPILL